HDPPRARRRAAVRPPAARRQGGDRHRRGRKDQAHLRGGDGARRLIRVLRASQRPPRAAFVFGGVQFAAASPFRRTFTPWSAKGSICTKVFAAASYFRRTLRRRRAAKGSFGPN